MTTRTTNKSLSTCWYSTTFDRLDAWRSSAKLHIFPYPMDWSFSVKFRGPICKIS